MIVLNRPYTVNAVSWSFSGQMQTLLPSVTFQALVDGIDGDTIIVPDIPGFPKTKYTLPARIQRQTEYRCLYSAY
jgi:hypothetical protein